MLEKNRRWHSIALILFALTLFANYLSAAGLLFPYDQKMISDTYANYLAPAGFTFSIWGLIYLGMAVTLALPWLRGFSRTFQSFYQQKIMPVYVLWLGANLLWIIFWSYNLIFLALVTIVVYALSLLYLVRLLAGRLELSNTRPWLLKIPVGLHAGWLVFAAFANLMTLLIKGGIASYSILDIMLTTLLLVVACATILYLYRQFDNFALTVPALWALFGIIAKQWPSSSFYYSNIFVMLLGIVLFFMALYLHLKIHQEHRAHR